MWHLILSIVLALLFAVTGGGKVLGLDFATRNREALGVSPLFWRVTGLLEWAGAAGLVVGIWVAPLGVAAASGLALLMIGAIVSRFRAARVVPTPVAAPMLAGDIVVLALVVLTGVFLLVRV